MLRFTVWVFALVAGLLMAMPLHAESMSPERVVQKIADDLASKVGSNRAELKNDNEKV